jgi:hypothetical protein
MCNDTPLSKVLDQRFSNCGANPPWGHRWSSGGGGVDFVRDIFILNKIWVQHKINILVGTLLG